MKFDMVSAISGNGKTKTKKVKMTKKKSGKKC